MANLNPVYLNQLGIVCPLGNSPDEVLRHLINPNRDGLIAQTHWLDDQAVYVGHVNTEFPALPEPFNPWDCRNNQLLLSALRTIEPAVREAIDRYGAHRVGVVLGTSTSGILDAEAAMIQWCTDHSYPADYHYDKQELGTTSRLLAGYLGVTGPCYVISTACTSSAKALAAAQRLIQTDLCDAVVVGGADTLCQLTIRGFSSLKAVAKGYSNPFATERDGINLGEAAVLFLMTAQPTGVALVGAGESSDAYHISAPHPQGRGAITAMKQALNHAGLNAAALDYLNMHGTGTQQNDAMESHAVNAVFGATVPVSSTKSMTGHTLGAAGALEAAFCWLLLSPANHENVLPANLMEGDLDPTLASIDLLTENGRFQRRKENWMMSNSFAFGGNNVCLLFKGLN